MNTKWQHEYEALENTMAILIRKIKKKVLKQQAKASVMSARQTDILLHVFAKTYHVR